MEFTNIAQRIGFFISKEILKTTDDITNAIKNKNKRFITYKGFSFPRAKVEKKVHKTKSNTKKD